MRKSTEDKLSDLPNYDSNISEELKAKWVDWAFASLHKNADIVQVAVNEELGGEFVELGLDETSVGQLGKAAKAAFIIGFLAALRGAFDSGDPDAEKIIKGEMEE